MFISSAARRYCEQRGVSKTLTFNVDRFVKVMSDLPLAEMTEATLNEFIRKARMDHEYSQSSIKGSVCAIRTLLRAEGISLRVPVVKESEPNINPPDNVVIDAIWDHLKPWMQQHVALTWFTAARLSDVIAMQSQRIPQDASFIRWTAAKTKIQHVVPVPEWLRQWLGSVPLGITASLDWSKAVVRKEIGAACTKGGVEPVLPRQIRQAGYQAWSMTGWAGKVLHDGKVEGVMGRYVNPLSVLTPAMSRLVVPVSMRGAVEESSEDVLLSSFRKMDDTARSLLLGMSDRLAAG